VSEGGGEQERFDLPADAPPPDLSALPEVLQRLIAQNNMPPELLSVTVAAFAASYSGPLPPPEQLAGYERVLPGAADRILAMAESQAEHRQNLEQTAIGGASRRSWWGLWLGFAIAVVVFVLGTIMVMTGHDGAGASVMAVDVATLAGVFVFGRVDQKRERQAKDAASQPQLPRLPRPN
jgi:uncharacterized membrane protein